MSSLYCNICGCPLTCCFLRALSTLQKGDDSSRSWDDSCTCIDDSSDSGSDIDSDHAPWCQSLLGYNGQLLSQADLEWLTRCRMVVLESPQPSNNFTWEGTMSDVGKYVAGQGLVTEQQTFPPNAGFAIHDSCWIILLAVHFKETPTQPLCVTRLDQLMRQYWERNCVNWGDGMYNWAALFQGEEWEPTPGLEWLVTDPFKHTDFSDFVYDAAEIAVPIHHFINPCPDPYMDTGDETESDPDMAVEIHSGMSSNTTTQDGERRGSDDPFIDSPGSPNMQMTLSNPMMYRLFFEDIPFIEQFSRGLPQVINEVLAEPGTTGINYARLCGSLRNASAIPNIQDVCLNHWELKNRARIWKCCERIIEKMR